jgi:membrane-bound lytic murein transglycosylase D
MRVNNRMFRFLALVGLLAMLLSACASQTPVPADPPTPESDAAVAGAADVVPEAEEPKDLWLRIRSGLTLPEPDTQLVARHEKWFARNPEYISRMVERARLYLYYIVEEVERRKMPMEIALLPAIESSYKPHAYSRARAAGLWQFIPSTGRVYGLHNDWWYDGRRDVISATNAALDYLQSLSDSFEGDWHLALASYNAGERRVRGARQYNRKRGRPDDYVHLRTLKPETRNYVPKLIAFAKVVKDPEKYGIQLQPIPNEPYFAEVETGSQIDLGIAAKLANIPLGDLYDINPGHKRWATSPAGPHRLLVPADKKDDLIEALSSLPEEQRIRWQRHHIRQGEALSTIARRYGVSVQSIRQANRLRSNRIRAGKSLLIPVSSRRLGRHYANLTRPVKRKPAPAPAGTVAVIHEIKSGDTLWSISQQYNVYMRQLARWNGIGTRSVLRPGRKLKVWIKPSPAPDTEAVPENARTDSADSPA